MVIIITFLYLVFTTHYCEVLDQMGRQDNIWVCNANSHIHLANMYEVYHIRPALLKCELPLILHLKKLILCNLHKMSFFLILLQLSDRR